MVVIDDTHITIRFKHSIYTIFLFVDVLETFDTLSNKLVAVLRQRYPQGLPKSGISNWDAVQTHKLDYALLIKPQDPARGWRKIETSGTDAIVKVTGIKNGVSVAFRLTNGSQDKGDFDVDWPTLEEAVDIEGE